MRLAIQFIFVSDKYSIYDQRFRKAFAPYGHSVTQAAINPAIFKFHHLSLFLFLKGSGIEVTNFIPFHL